MDKERTLMLFRANMRSFFVKTLVGLVFGVLIAEWSMVSLKAALLMSAASLACAMIYMLAVCFGVVSYRSKMSAFFVLAISCFIGQSLASMGRVSPIEKPGEGRVMELVVRDYPEVSRKSVKLTLTLFRSSVVSDEKVYGKKVLLVVRCDSASRVSLADLSPGTHLVVNATLHSTHTNGSRDFGFDYDKYLRRHNYVGRAYVDSVSRVLILPSMEDKSFLNRFKKVQHQLVRRYQRAGVGEESRALLGAICLGDKKELSRSQRNQFSSAGASHVLVVSGMHVGYIFMLVMMTLPLFASKWWRRVVCLMGIVVIGSYAVLTGLSPSVVRAAFMSVMVLVMYMLGLQYMVRNAIALSAIVLIMADANVIFDVGFQLSYLAVVSIIYFTPLLAHWICVDRVKIFWLRNALMPVCVTLAAQILTAPLVMLQFGQFPVFFLVTNIFVSFFAPVIFIGGLLLVAVSGCGVVGQWVAVLMDWVCRLFGTVIGEIASWPMSLWKTHLSLAECVALYVLVWVVAETVEDFRAGLARRFAGLWRVAVCGCVVVVVIVETMEYGYGTQYLIVDDGSSLAVNVCGAEYNVVYSDSDTTWAHSLFSPLWSSVGAPDPMFVSCKQLNDNGFVFGEESYLILRENSFRYCRAPLVPFSVDNLIVSSRVYPSVRYSSFLSPRRVILSSGMSRQRIDMWKKLFLSEGVEWYDVAKEGEYVKKIEKDSRKINKND